MSQHFLPLLRLHVQKRLRHRVVETLTRLTRDFKILAPAADKKSANGKLFYVALMDGLESLAAGNFGGE